MKRNLTIVVTALLLIVAVSVEAQSDSGLIVNSTPPGANVLLEGDAVVSGVTPVSFRYTLIGKYRLTLKMSGYEDYHTNIVLDPARQMQMDVSLSRKTGAKAAVRSMFLPGWGQQYTEQRSKGFTFSLLFAGAVAAYFVADHNFDIKNERFSRRLTEYDDAVDRGVGMEELEIRLRDLNEAQEDAFDAEDVRRISIGTVAGVWAINVLDALLFSPKERATVSIEGLAISPKADSQGIGITLSRAF
ncbi:MAG: PEGA domain-containing protein [bacterium]|nr:PEGA domain-containing protein [bacterium]